MKTYRKHIDGIFLGSGMKIAEKKLKDKDIESTFILTALNGRKIFKKISESEIVII